MKKPVLSKIESKGDCKMEGRDTNSSTQISVKISKLANRDLDNFAKCPAGCHGLTVFGKPCLLP